MVPFLRPIAALRPLLNRGLPQAELDKLWRLRARMDFQEGIPINPRNRPVAPPDEFSPQAFFPSPTEIQSFRIPSGVSPSTRPILGRGIDDVVIRPSIAEEYMPRLARTTPLPDEPGRYLPAPTPSPHMVGSERFDAVINPIVPGQTPAQVRYMPLPSSEVERIRLYARDEPLSAVMDAVRAVEDAVDPRQFAVALQAVRAVRRGVPDDPLFASMQRVLDDTINTKAVQLGIPEDVIESLPLISNAARARGLYKESEKLASEGWSATEQNALPFLRSIRKMRKSISGDVGPSSSDMNSLREMIMGANGGNIMRLARSGEIDLAQARLLHDEAVDTYVRMLQADLSQTIRGRGIQLLDNPRLAVMSDEGKANLYGLAIQSASSSDEVSAISALWRADISNPNFIDELDLLEAHSIERLNSYAKVDPWAGRPRVSSTIDEASIDNANAAIRQDEARRAASDTTRPVFPSDDVTPEDTLVRTQISKKEAEKLGPGNYDVVETPGGLRYYTVEGGGQSTLVNQGFTTPPPSPSVAPGAGRIVGFNREFAGPGSYIPRTIQNAQEGDITIAVARNFETGGEKLTAAAAAGRVSPVKRGDKWESEWGRPGQHGRVTELEQISHMSADIDSHVESIVGKLNRISAQQGRPVVINGAGNGLASLDSQESADVFARHIIDRIVNHPQRGFEIDHVVTGGQNGYDIALAKAAKAYGIPVKINPPYTRNGSIMLQDPNNPRAVIFMNQQEYVRNYRLDTGEVGEAVATTATRAAKESSVAMSIPMNFADGTRGLRMAPQNAGKSTMDLIIEGSRTGTTRANVGQFKKADGSMLGVGDVVKFTDRAGRSVKVEITKAPYRLPESPDSAKMNLYARTWSQYEGWDPSFYKDFVGQWQVQYKLLDS